MPSKIDDKTTLPLSLVIVLLGACVGISANGAFWISRVDERLSRIEKQLKIASSPAGLIPAAEAAPR